MSREEANRIVRAVERARRTRRAGLKLALPTAAALGAGAAIAIGAIPSGDGTITGCYVTNTDIFPGGAAHYGQLRIIDPSQPSTLPTGGPNDAGACLNGEATVTWNQRGPQGPQGPQGPIGLQGPAGRDLIGQTTFGFGGGGGRTFLKIEGVKGESSDKAHKGEIEVSSFSIGAQGTAAHGGGGGAGKVTFSSFTITKRIDKASPLLFKAAATGQHFKQAVVSFARTKRGRETDYLEIKMNDVLISALQDGTSHSQVPTEQVTFNFAKVQETFLSSSGRPIQTISINVGVDKKA